MSNYKRLSVVGATVFFTVNLARREGTLLVDHIDLLREAVEVTKARRPFDIKAWVVLPDHMHAVWTLPEGDANYSDRWGAIKARFSKFVRLREGTTVGHRPTLRLAHGDTDFWQTSSSGIFALTQWKPAFIFRGILSLQLSHKV